MSADAERLDNIRRRHVASLHGPSPCQPNGPSDLCAVFAALAARDAELAGWQEIAAQENRNRDYYRALVVQIGELFGPAARTADDGGIAEDVLCAKVPGLVAAELARLREAASSLVGELTGAFGIAEPEIRAALGNTNVTCLKNRHGALAALLAPAAPTGRGA